MKIVKRNAVKEMLLSLRLEAVSAILNILRIYVYFAISICTVRK